MLSDKLTVILAISLAICLTIIGALGYFSWNLKTEIEELKADNVQLPFSALNLDDQSKHKIWEPWSNNWDPIPGFTSLHKNMDQLINSFSNSDSLLEQFINGSVKVSLEEEPSEYRVTVKIPEGQEIILNTELEGNHLFLEGEILRENANSGNGRESSFKQSTRFSRTLTLNGKIDKLGMKVVNHESQYTITIPKV